MSTGKNIEEVTIPANCSHKAIKQGPHSRYIYCTSCSRRWEQRRDGHYGTTWVANDFKVLKKGGGKTNDDDVSQKSPESRR